VVATAKPAQAVYLMATPQQPRPRDQVSAFAFTVKNLVRPAGLDRLGLPCPLTGTGMAFPRSLLENIPLASGNIVEDMQLGIDLTLRGRGPRLCEDARGTGILPRGRDAALRQRERWEHGHLRTLVREVPRLMIGGIARGRLGAIAVALDLLVPPLSLLVMLLAVGVALAAGHWWITRDALPLALFGGAGVLLTMTTLAAWARFGCECLPARSLLSAGAYVIWKIPIYAMFVRRPQNQWIRTQRDATTTHRGRVVPVEFSEGIIHRRSAEDAEVRV
jgi:hypothetical protein